MSLCTRAPPTWVDGKLTLHAIHRCATHNSTTLLQQPRTPLTGQLQAIELDIRWKEMESQMLAYYEILSLHTGHSIEKLKHDLYYPLYMSPADAIEYGIIDNVRAQLLARCSRLASSNSCICAPLRSRSHYEFSVRVSE